MAGARELAWHGRGLLGSSMVLRVESNCFSAPVHVSVGSPIGPVVPDVTQRLWADKSLACW